MPVFDVGGRNFAMTKIWIVVGVDAAVRIQREEVR